jgi:hypothetical protein
VGHIDVGADSAEVRVEREAMRLDVNKAALTDIDGLLHDKGIQPDQRAAILARIGEARAARRLIGTFADVAALGHGILDAGKEQCLPAILSPFGDLRVSVQTGNNDVQGASPVRVGETLRVTIAQGARRQAAVIRVVGTRDEPYSVLDWYDDVCAGGSVA